MSVPTVKLNSGRPTFVDHTPVGAVTGGDVVVVGNVPMIAANDIVAGELGALASFDGVYTVPKAITSGSGIAAGVKVYWNASAKQVTTTASSHKVFGYTTALTADADTEVNVVHAPLPA